MNYKLFLIFLSGILIALYHAIAHSNQPVAGKTGAPSENNCSQCHTGNPINSQGKVAIKFMNPDSTYKPNKEYLMEVVVEKDTFNTFGFEVVAIQQSTNKTIGTFIITDSARTQLFNEIVDGETRNYIGHTKTGTKTSTSGKNNWNFIWKSPSTNVGNIVFYVASNAANGKGTRFNDWVYTSTVTINQGVEVGEMPIVIDSLAVWPNYTINELTIYYKTATPKLLGLQLVDAKGSLILSETIHATVKGINLTSIPLPANLSGIFFVNIELNSKIIVKKIVL